MLQDLFLYFVSLALFFSILIEKVHLHSDLLRLMFKNIRIYFNLRIFELINMKFADYGYIIITQQLDQTYFQLKQLVYFNGNNF